MKLLESGEIPEGNTELTLEKGEFDWKIGHLEKTFLEEINLTEGGEIQNGNIKVEIEKQQEEGEFECKFEHFVTAFFSRDDPF